MPMAYGDSYSAVQNARLNEDAGRARDLQNSLAFFSNMQNWTAVQERLKKAQEDLNRYHTGLVENAKNREVEKVKQSEEDLNLENQNRKQIADSLNNVVERLRAQAEQESGKVMKQAQGAAVSGYQAPWFWGRTGSGVEAIAPFVGQANAIRNQYEQQIKEFMDSQMTDPRLAEAGISIDPKTGKFVANQLGDKATEPSESDPLGLGIVPQQNPVQQPQVGGWLGMLMQLLNQR